MQIKELQNLNKDYNSLMNFIGLAELRNEFGLTENSTDQLEYLECALYDSLDIREKEQLQKYLKRLKELIDVVMERMQNRVNQHLKTNKL